MNKTNRGTSPDIGNRPWKAKGHLKPGGTIWSDLIRITQQGSRKAGHIKQAEEEAEREIEELNKIDDECEGFDILSNKDG